MSRRPRRLAVHVAAFGVLAASACGSGGRSSAGDARPDVVVTFPVLGAVVRDVVGALAKVEVLMPNGTDPHEWSASARDVDKLLKADLVVDNGLGLEGRLRDPLKEAAARGVQVFSVADHVTVRKVGAGEGAGSDDPDQAPGADDPHLWTDPLTMKQWIGPFAEVVRQLGVDVSSGAEKAAAGLDEVHAAVQRIVATVPADRRKLVTGHESLGYFAERYGFQLVGAVVPAVTSQAEASAGALARLADKIRAAGVTTVFAEVGTSKATVEAVARDSGARVVELTTHALAKDGTYATYLTDIATTIASALG